jgi:hypothetical protein
VTAMVATESWGHCDLNPSFLNQPQVPFHERQLLPVGQTAESVWPTCRTSETISGLKMLKPFRPRALA